MSTMSFCLETSSGRCIPHQFKLGIQCLPFRLINSTIRSLLSASLSISLHLRRTWSLPHLTCLPLLLPFPPVQQVVVNLNAPFLLPLFMLSWPCVVPTCKKVCRSPGGLTQHINNMHRHHENFGKREKAIHCTFHPILDGKCNHLA